MSEDSDPDSVFETETDEWIETDEIRIRYDPATETYQITHNKDDQRSLTTTVLFAVGALSGMRPRELPPLHEYVDPEALDRIFESGIGKDPDHQRTAGRLTVPYAGFLVTVHAGGEITLRSRPDVPESTREST